MANTYKIIGFHETCGDKFFKVAITNAEGETHTDIYSYILIQKFVGKGAKFEVDMENDDLINAVEELAYITICEEEENEKAVYDVYLHKITADDFLEVDFAGEFLKTYKSENAALKFAAKKGHPVH